MKITLVPYAGLCNRMNVIYLVEMLTLWCTVNNMIRIYHLLFVTIPTCWYCLLSGLRINLTWKLCGKFHINHSSWLLRKKHPEIKKGQLIIGDYFSCNNKLTSNSVGIFQPCFFNISASGSKIIIGNNVGISGSTINDTTTITNNWR